MHYAIDRKTIADALGYGFMMPYETIYPTPIPGYTPGLARQFDLAKAKQLMADAGLADGFETTMYVSQFANDDVMVAVQQCLAEIGITARISNVDMGKWTALRKTGWDGLLYQHGIFQAPYEYNLNRAYGPAYADYVSMARPEGFDDLLAQLMNTTDAKARLPMAKQIQQMVYDTACFIPLVTWAQIDAVDPKVRDHEMYKIHGTQCWSPEKTWIAK
jgi:peptide/nickel transport system substrate-binding protein